MNSLPKNYLQKIPLGKTGLMVSRMGVGCSYGVSTTALEEAFENGINYFYFGTLRRAAMARAVHHLAPRFRDQLVIAIQSYSRWPRILRSSVDIALRKLKLDFADILLLGKVDRLPSGQLVDELLRLKSTGKVRFLAISAHKRMRFAEYIHGGIFDVIMARYNAAHLGAERDVFPLLQKQDRPGVICYTATRWGTLLSSNNGEPAPKASDCYRFVLRQPCVDICLCGPKDRSEMKQAVEVLRSSPMDEDEAAWMRRIGAAVYNKKAHNYLLNKLIFD